MKPGATRVSSRCRLPTSKAGCAPRCVREQRRQAADEAGAATELHLERQALALVDRHRASARHRLAERLARQVLLVARVPGLVDRAHQALHEVVFAIARGDPRVFRHAAAERVRALVEAAAFEIEAEQCHHVEAQGALRRFRERSGGCHHRIPRLPFAHRAHELRQPGLQVAEQGRHLDARHARLELVHQRVVERQAARLGEVLRFLARQADHLAQVDGEASPVVGRTLAAPGVLAVRSGERLGLDQRLRQGVRALPVAPDLAQVRTRRLVERLGFGAREQRGQARVGTQAVQERIHLGQRASTRLAALGRHHRRAIPAGDRLEMAEVVQACPGAGQLVVGGGLHA